MVDEVIFLRQLSALEQNVLKWAALLHDIKKRLLPLFNGRDHIHPFMSGMATLDILRDLNILVLDTDEQ